MPQSAMTVRLDSQMKSRFDELCATFGMSANKAINVFVNAVVRTQSIYPKLPKIVTSAEFIALLGKRK